MINTKYCSLEELLVIPLQFDEVESFSEDLAGVKINNKKVKSV